MSYEFDHDWRNEHERLLHLESVLDPGTIRHIEEIGVSEGWRCLEIGGGNGSIARWLCRHVGPSGQVIATDLQTGFLECIKESNLEIRKHDITTDPIESSYYDFIHVRCVLEHISTRDSVIRKIIRALRPGGWLMLEATDFVSSVSLYDDNENGYINLTNKINDFLKNQGFDPEYGRRLGIELRSHGLVSVGFEGRVYEVGSEHPLMEVWRLNIEKLRESLVKANVAVNKEIDNVIDLTQRQEFYSLSPIVVAAWGQKC